MKPKPEVSNRADVFNNDQDIRYHKVLCLASDKYVCCACRKTFSVKRTFSYLTQVTYIHAENGGTTQNLGFLCYRCNNRIELKRKTLSLFEQGELEDGNRREFK